MNPESRWTCEYVRELALPKEWVDRHEPGCRCRADGWLPIPLPEVSNWKGAGGSEHRTVGPHRAWCHDDLEWCYPEEEMWCDCCHEANGYIKTWVKMEGE